MDGEQLRRYQLLPGGIIAYSSSRAAGGWAVDVEDLGVAVERELRSTGTLVQILALAFFRWNQTCKAWAGGSLFPQNITPIETKPHVINYAHHPVTRMRNFVA